jgi:hypothetical protein
MLVEVANFKLKAAKNELDNLSYGGTETFRVTLSSSVKYSTVYV